MVIENPNPKHGKQIGKSKADAGWRGIQVMMENGGLQPAWPQDLYHRAVLSKRKKRIILEIPERDFM